MPIAEQISYFHICRMICISAFMLHNKYFVVFLENICWYGSQWGSLFLPFSENWHCLKCSWSTVRGSAGFLLLVDRIIPSVDYLWFMPHSLLVTKQLVHMHLFFFSLLIVFLFLALFYFKSQHIIVVVLFIFEQNSL